MKRFAVFLTLLQAIVFSQITVNINSGNPAAPFPQFQPYVNPTDTLYNLATKNPVGVSHAEMERSIREAYQIMMNRASKPGGGVGGIDYVYYVSNPSCSEGDGYAMLAAAAMADKATFDGLWLWVHEKALNKVRLYSNCKESNPEYGYSQLPGWTNDRTSNSAADGDFDIALALLYAHKQWGEFMGINDSCGKPISYRQAAIDFIKALTDTLTYVVAGTGYGLLSGDIGIDGYVKNGDSWGEMTGWAGDTMRSGLPKPTQNQGSQEQYADYMAPAYFIQFADFLASQDSAAYAWNIRQFRRAAASSDWLMGKLLDNPRYIPFAGKIRLAETLQSATFSQFTEGEDFRLGWRTILNRVWNGNPVSTWDASMHQVQKGVPNTFEQDIGKRYASFLWDARQEPWGNGCVRAVSTSGAYWGPSMLTNSCTVDGKISGYFFLNWIQGTGSPSAVVAQDFNLMAEMYRQCEIAFDVDKPGDGYLTCVPFYYHDWFRLLGMLVLSGNYLPPSQIRPTANLKIYGDADKTCTVPGEDITYTLTYRNYGSAAAKDVVLNAQFPKGSSFVSCTGNGSFVPGSQKILWNFDSIPGFSTTTGIVPTTGQVTFTVRVDAGTSGQLEAGAFIYPHSNIVEKSGWRMNEYPDNISAICKRNYVDIINQPVNDTLKVKALPVLHGGRPGVHFSFSSGAEDATHILRTVRLKIFSDAQEPYIDFGNYRLSYFIYDTLNTGVVGVDGCVQGWNIVQNIIEGIDKKNVRLIHQMLTPGENVHGKWNQRIIVQLSDPADTARIDQFWTTNRHLEVYRGMKGLIHRGGTEPLNLEFQINSSDWSKVKWDDDWSWNSRAIGKDFRDPGFPITPDFTDPAPNNPGVPVDRLNPKHCETTDTTVDNILVEEWDGYVWRRVFGNAPQIATGAALSTRLLKVNKLSMHVAAPGALRYTLPLSGMVQLQVLDMKGRVVAAPVDGLRKAGTYTVQWASRNTGAGIYTARLIAGSDERIVRVVNIR